MFTDIKRLYQSFIFIKSVNVIVDKLTICPAKFDESLKVTVLIQ